MCLRIPHVRTEANSCELHWVVRSLVEIITPKPLRAPKSTQSRARAGFEQANDLLIPAVLLDQEVVMQTSHNLCTVVKRALDAEGECWNHSANLLGLKAVVNGGSVDI